MKYKLWCKNKNEWEKDSWVILPNGNIAWIEYGNIVGCANPKNHILVRSTGLKDINDKYIYEGDIIKSVSIIHKDEQPVSIIKWDRGQYDVFDNEGSWISSLYKYMMVNNIEVIGNVYENPELLK